MIGLVLLKGVTYWKSLGNTSLLHPIMKGSMSKNSRELFTITSSAPIPLLFSPFHVSYFTVHLTMQSCATFLLI